MAGGRDRSTLIAQSATKSLIGMGVHPEVPHFAAYWAHQRRAYLGVQRY